MATRVRVSADGFIHALCPEAGCGVALQIRPPQSVSRFACPHPGCGCRFTVTPIRPTETDAPDSKNVTCAGEAVNIWEEIMNAVCAEEGRSGARTMRRAYRRTRRLRAADVARNRIRVAAAVGTVAILIGLSILVSAQLLERPDSDETLILSGDHAALPAFVLTSQSAPVQVLAEQQRVAELGPKPASVLPAAGVTQESSHRDPATVRPFGQPTPV